MSHSGDRFFFLFISNKNTALSRISTGGKRENTPAFLYLMPKTARREDRKKVLELMPPEERVREVNRIRQQIQGCVAEFINRVRTAKPLYNFYRGRLDEMLTRFTKDHGRRAEDHRSDITAPVSVPDIEQADWDLEYVQEDIAKLEKDFRKYTTGEG